MSVPASLSLGKTQKSTGALNLTNLISSKPIKSSGHKFAKLIKKDAPEAPKKKEDREASSKQDTSSIEALLVEYLKEMLAQSHEAQSQSVQQDDKSTLTLNGTEVSQKDFQKMISALENKNEEGDPKEGALISKISSLLQQENGNSSSMTLSNELTQLLEKLSAQTTEQSLAEKSSASAASQKALIKSLVKLLDKQNEEATPTKVERSEKDQSGEGVSSPPQSAASQDTHQDQIMASVSVNMREDNVLQSEPARGTLSAQDALAKLSRVSPLNESHAAEQGSEEGSLFSSQTQKTESSDISSKHNETEENFATLLGSHSSQEVKQTTHEAKGAASPVLEPPSTQGEEKVSSMSAEAFSKADLSLSVQTLDQENVHVQMVRTENGTSVSLQAQNDQTTDALQKTHHILSQEMDKVSPEHLGAKISVLPTDTSNSPSHDHSSFNQNSFSQQGQSFTGQDRNERNNASASSYMFEEGVLYDDFATETVARRSSVVGLSDGNSLNISV